MKLSDHARRLEYLQHELGKLSMVGSGLRFERYGSYITLRRTWPGQISSATLSEQVIDERVIDATIGILNDPIKRAQLFTAVVKMMQEDAKDTKATIVQSLVS